MDSLLGGVSASCQASLPSLLTSSFASCANIVGLVSLATASGSLVPALNTYIGDLCTSTPCTDADISGASTIIKNGCASDIANNSTIPIALNLIVENFDGVRALMCTQRTSNSSYCLPEVLYAAQNATGTELTFSTLSSLGAGNGTEALLSSIPKSVYCTDCGDALVTEIVQIAQNISADVATELSNSAVQTCGAAFGDGQLPAGITNGTTTAGVANAAGSGKSSGNTGAAGRSMDFSGKALALIGTVSTLVLGAFFTLA